MTNQTLTGTCNGGLGGKLQVSSHSTFDTKRSNTGLTSLNVDTPDTALTIMMRDNSPTMELRVVSSACMVVVTEGRAIPRNGLRSVTYNELLIARDFNSFRVHRTKD